MTLMGFMYESVNIVVYALGVLNLTNHIIGFAKSTENVGYPKTFDLYVSKSVDETKTVILNTKWSIQKTINLAGVFKSIITGEVVLKTDGSIISLVDSDKIMRKQKIF